MNIDFVWVYEHVWAVGAIFLGTFSLVYTKQFNERNAVAFEKWHKKTNMGVLKEMAQGTRGSTQYLVTKIVGAIFIIYGLIILFG